MGEYMCNWRGCKNKGRHYRDISITGIPDIWMFCEKCVDDFDETQRKRATPMSNTITLEELEELEQRHRACPNLAIQNGPMLFALISLAKAGLSARWRDISTAPKDGTVFDVWLGNAADNDVLFYCGPFDTQRSPNWTWQDGKFRPAIPGVTPIIVTVEPTHWVPTPTPPQEGG